MESFDGAPEAVIDGYYSYCGRKEGRNLFEVRIGVDVHLRIILLVFGGGLRMMTNALVYTVAMGLSVGVLADVVLLSRWCSPVPVGAILGALVGFVLGWRSET